jgi:hypothetical protein
MHELTNRDLLRSIALAVLGGFGGLLIAYVAVSPSRGLLVLALYGVMSLAIALSLPPHVLMPAALLVVGISTAFSSAVSVGPVTIYVTDLAILLIFSRGVLPRARHFGRRALRGVPQTLFLLWIFIMTVAGIRAILAGVPSASVIRSDLALFYWPLLYFAFTRILAEVDIDVGLLWRNLVLVAAGFAAYMFIARALNHPFQNSGLAQVPTGPGEVVPRNFGFASAFTIYPVLALTAVAVMAATRDRRFRWALLAIVGVVATLTTLVRGEIFSLSLGILLVLWLSPRIGSHSVRARTAGQLAVAAAAAVLAVLAVDPKLGHAVIQRSLPFTHQAESATANADYRFEAMGAGIRVARAHPTGLGVLDQQRFTERDIDPGFLVHSGFATLLFYGGWPALAVSVLTLLLVIRRSFQAAAASRWLHPAFVGAITMLSLYSLGAQGLAGDSAVVPLGALVVALRFGLQPDTR